MEDASEEVAGKQAGVQSEKYRRCHSHQLSDAPGFQKTKRVSICVCVVWCVWCVGVGVDVCVGVSVLGLGYKTSVVSTE